MLAPDTWTEMPPHTTGLQLNCQKQLGRSANFRWKSTLLNTLGVHEQGISRFVHLPIPVALLTPYAILSPAVCL